MKLSNAEILETARRRAGITQNDLAKELGVSLPTYSRWIKGSFDDVLLIHAHILEELLNVKFFVDNTPDGKRIKISL